MNGANESVDTQVHRRPTRGRFYVGAAVLVILLNAAGFGPSFIDRSNRIGAPTWLVTAHGTVAGAWLLLFLAQAMLVATGRIKVHRRLGVAGAFIAFTVIAVGSLSVIDMARRGHDLSGDLGRVAVAPGSPAPASEEYAAQRFPELQAFANFGILAALGLWFRHRPEIHKRLMLLALLQLAVLTPLIHLSGHLIGHWPGLYTPLNIAIPIINISLLFAGAAHDKLSRGRIHPIFLWVPVLILVETLGLIAFVMPSAGWHQIAMWLVS